MALGLIAASSAAATAIFKWTDADGVVHYSDQAVPGAEQIVISAGSANGISSARGPAQPSQPKVPAAQAHAAVFSIESPAPEQVFFGDDIVPVRLSLDPALQPEQSVTWNLNGTQLANQGPKSVAFALSMLARGTYVLAATLTDTVTGKTQSTDSVTFYVREPSALAPLNPRHR
jgi:hypothetical protein